jgi:hypothetical protein
MCPNSTLSSDPIPLTAEQARRIAVRAQLLDGSATDVLHTVRRLGYLQLDPTNRVARPDDPREQPVVGFQKSLVQRKCVPTSFAPLPREYCQMRGPLTPPVKDH